MTYSDQQTRKLINPKFPDKEYLISWSKISGEFVMTGEGGTLVMDVSTLDEQMERFRRLGWTIEGEE